MPQMLPCIGIVTINIGSISNFAYFINFWCLLTINNKYIENPFLIEPQQNTYKYSYTCINSLSTWHFTMSVRMIWTKGKKYSQPWSIIVYSPSPKSQCSLIKMLTTKRISLCSQLRLGRSYVYNLHFYRLNMCTKRYHILCNIAP